MRTLLALLLLAASAHAEPLKAILVVPQTAVSGSDVYIDASQSTGEIKHYLIFADKLGANERVIGKGDIVQMGDPKKPRLRTLVGRWRVRLIVVAGDGRYDETESLCVIPGCDVDPLPPPDDKPSPSPTPIPPKPEPKPAPQPDVIPAGEFGVAPKVYVIAGKVQSAARAAEAKKIADACDVLAAQIAAGTLTDPQKLVTAMANELKKYPAWQGATTEVGKVIQETVIAHKSGRLKINGLVSFSMAEPDGWRVLVKEIGVGLRAVK